MNTATPDVVDPDRLAALAHDIESAWWPSDLPRRPEPSYASTEIAHRVIDLGETRPVPSTKIDDLCADIADFIHTALDHPISGVCHGDNDACEGGPSQRACELADEDLAFLNIDEINDYDEDDDRA